MSTTKLTRKEILAEDPVHEAMIKLLDLLRERGKAIALVGAAAIVLAVCAYFALQYLDSREMQAQQEMARAMSLFHAQIDPAAVDDPFGKGPNPIFRNETAKYQSASREFESFIKSHGSSKLAVMARYYLGLSQLRLDRRNEAVKLLEQVSSNTQDRTLGYLARRILVHQYLESGNAKGAQQLLDGMIADPQCDLPKDELKLELARIFVSQGKRDQALKTLREARDESGKSYLQGSIIQELSRLEGKQ